MIRAISLEELDKTYERLTFPYQAYCRSFDDEVPVTYKFVAVGSSTTKIRARNEWNTKGREIYDRTDVASHASFASQILGELGLTEFVIQQAIPSALWFCEIAPEASERAFEMVNYLESKGISEDFSTWKGAFILQGDVLSFLQNFLDYAFVLNTYQLELISLQEPLILVLNHHLTIQYTSPDQNLVDSLKARIVAEGILECPDRSE